jgi:hypothetical protein
MSQSILTLTFTCGKPRTYTVPEGTLEAGQAMLATHLPNLLRPLVSVTLMNAEGVDLWAATPASPKGKGKGKAPKAASAPVAPPVPVKPVALSRSNEYAKALAQLEAAGKGYVAARIRATTIAKAARKVA